MERTFFKTAWLRLAMVERGAVATRLGTTPNHLRNIAYGSRHANPALALSIERLIGVSRRDLRPRDWGDIWPELIDAEHPWPAVAVDTSQKEAA